MLHHHHCHHVVAYSPNHCLHEHGFGWHQMLAVEMDSELVMLRELAVDY